MPSRLPELGSTAADLVREPLRPGPLRSGLGRAVQVVAWLVILGVGAVLLLAVLVPRAMAGTPYVILTSSMRPAMPPGTLVVTKPVDTDHVGIGTVVTYQLHSGDPSVVTHRVTEVGIDSTGGYHFTTKGDANDVADAKTVQPVQIRGERAYYVPYLGYVTTLVGGTQRHWAIVLVVVSLLGYAATMFAGAARERRGQRHPSALMSAAEGRIR